MNRYSSELLSPKNNYYKYPKNQITHKTFENFLFYNDIKFIKKDVRFLLMDFGAQENILTFELMKKFIESNVWDK